MSPRWTRRAALEHWVESGGRLVVDDNLVDPSDDLESWSGIMRTYPDRNTLKNRKAGDDPLCRRVEQELACPLDSAYWRCALIDHAEEILAASPDVFCLLVDLEIYFGTPHHYDRGPCRCSRCLVRCRSWM